MTVAGSAQPVVVVRFGQTCGAGVARAALKGRWPILDGGETDVIRRLMTLGPRVMIVQMDEAGDHALALVERLARHWNPVFSVVIGPRSGLDHEMRARRCGAAAYVGEAVGCETVEQMAGQLVASRRGTPVAYGTSDSVSQRLGSGVSRAARA